jgi:MbtH protein
VPPPLLYHRLGSLAVQNLEERERDITYTVVVNDEEQYSIWPVDRDIPAGWRDAGKHGTKDECLKHVGEVWTDMRPASVRRRMDGDG